MVNRIWVDDDSNALEYIFDLQRHGGKSSSLKKGNQMLNSNDRLHYIVKGQITDFLRALSNQTVIDSNPCFNVEHPKYSADHPCGVLVTVFPPTKRRFDPPNIYPTVKALIDGMTDAGVWDDDNNKVIKIMGFRLGGLSHAKTYRVTINIFDWSTDND